MSIFVYRLETSSVARIQLFGSRPNARNRLMKLVVSRMKDAKASANGLKKSST